MELEKALVAKYVRDNNPRELESLKRLNNLNPVQQSRLDALQVRVDNYDLSAADKLEDILSGKSIDDRIDQLYQSALGKAKGSFDLDSKIKQLMDEAATQARKDAISASYKKHQERIKSITKKAKDCLGE